MRAPTRSFYPIALCTFYGSGLLAQTPPTSYTVVQVNSMMGTPSTSKIMRDGAKVVMEQGDSRQWFDLDTHKSWSISISAPDGCGTGAFSGDWGDPFGTTADLEKEGLKQTGTAMLNGASMKVYEGGAAPNNAKAWIDAKTGLAMRVDLGGKTIIETKQFTPGKPAMSMALPPACANVKPVETEAERIAEETHDSAENYTMASHGPASDGGCTVLVRAVKAGTMEPVPIPQVGLDLTYDVDNPPHYTTGIGTDGHLTFSGSNMKDVSAQIRNGALTIPGAPKTFYLETGFGSAGSADAGIYRHCTLPRSVLLMIVKNPAKISDGVDWLWAKSGKYASIN